MVFFISCYLFHLLVLVVKPRTLIKENSITILAKNPTERRQKKEVSVLDVAEKP